MIDFGIVKPGTTLYIPFASFAGSTGASVTLTGLATTDIEIYKDGGTTQRASDSGYALLDTDGIDFDGTTGIHGFSINLADNTTAGFYAAGSQYFVVISSVTVDSQTVNFIAARFTIGYPSAILNTTIATLSSQTSFTLTAGPAEDDVLNGMELLIHDVASAVQISRAIVTDYTGSTKTVSLVGSPFFTIAAGDNISVLGISPLAPTAAGRTLDVTTTGEAGIDWGNIGNPTTSIALSGTTVATATNVTTVNGLAAGVITASAVATGAIDADALAADAGTEIGTAVWATAARTLTAATNVTSTGAAVPITAGGLVSSDVTAISTDTTAADNLEFAFDDTAGAVPWMGILDQGTAQSATGTTLVLRAASAFADNVLIGSVVMVYGSTQGYWQVREITDYDLATDTITVDTWTTTPSGTITYKIFAGPPALSTLPAVNVTQVDGASLATHVSGYFPGDLRQISGSAVSTSTAQLGVNVVNFGGSAGTFASGIPAVNTTQLSGDSVAADNAESFFDGTGYAGTNNVIPLVTTTTTATNVTTVNGLAANVITAASTASDFITEIQTACSASLAAINLDHLISTAVDTDFATTVHLNSVIGHLADNGTSATFDRTTDSLEAIRDRGDAAWTGGGGGTSDWTTDERTAIRSILGIPASGTTPDDPTTGILDTIRDNIATVDTVVDSILADTGTDGVVVAAGSKTGYSLSSTGLDSVALPANLITASSIASDAITAAKIAADAIGASELATDAITEIATAVLTTAMTEAYRSAGSTGSVAQLLYEVIAHLGESSISGTTKTLKKLDGSTTAKTYTLNDSVTPTAITEST